MRTLKLIASAALCSVALGVTAAAAQGYGFIRSSCRVGGSRARRPDTMTG